MYEVYADGIPTGRLFMSEENAYLWIHTHGAPDCAYSVRPFARG